MLDTEIREEIRRYIVGDIDAGDLEVWFTSEGHGRLEGEPEATRQLAAETSRLVFERMNGDWTDAELRKKLGQLSRTFWLRSAPTVVLSSTSEVIRREDRAQGVVGTSLEAEYA